MSDGKRRLMDLPKPLILHSLLNNRRVQYTNYVFHPESFPSRIGLIAYFQRYLPISVRLKSDFNQ
ncbi:Uncharacterised protein [Pragia fontium]|nr:Uncharacterised protein [Pragia fontium]